MAGTPSLYGIVDLGTWSIRFSINSVQPQHARVLPCVFQDRAPIRLYKGPDTPISKEEIAQTLVVLRRFRSICKDYGVMPQNVQIAANPHEAPNFDELVNAINGEFHTEVLRLSKEGEHWANAYGVASATHEARGVYIELRPSYANVYYLSLCKIGDIEETLIGPVKVAYTSSAEPFGVSAVSDPFDPLKLFDEEEEQQAQGQPDVLSGFKSRLKEACTTLQEQAQRKGVFSPIVFLSGSGFHGLHTLLATATCGFGVVTTGLVFKPEALASVQSNSRLAQVVKAVSSSLPDSTNKVVFVHHNLRNGLLFQALPPVIRYQDPMIIATRPYALPGAKKLADQLQSGLPKEICPSFFWDRLAPAAANAAYIHSSYNAEIQSFSALVVATCGVLAGTQGITNEEKVLLGLALSQRWGGTLDANGRELRCQMISSLTDPRMAWWARYTGLILHLLGAAYPGAHVREGILEVDTEVAPDKEHFTLRVNLFKGCTYSDNVIMRQRIARVQKQVHDLGGPVEFVVEYLVRE